MKKISLLFLVFLVCISAQDPFAEGDKLIKEERLEDALKIFQKIVRENPNDAEAWLRISGLYKSLNNGQEAQLAIEKAIKISPLNVKYLIDYARLANWIGNYQLALKTYRKVIELEPNNRVARNELEAMKGWVRLTSDATGVPEEGLLAEKENDWKKALEIYRNTLQKDPNNSLWLYVAEIEYKRGDIKQALAAQEHASTIFSKNAEVFDRLAELYLANLQPQKSVAAIQHALTLDPQSSKYQNAYSYYQYLATLPLPLVRSLQELRWEDAINGYKEYLKEHPEKSEAWIALANIQSALGRFEETIFSFVQAAKASPKDPQIHYFLANMYRLTHQKKRAWEEIQLAVQLDPLNIDLWQSYRLIALENGLKTEAALALKYIVSRNPQFKV